MQTDINMPFVLKYDRRTQEFDLIAKTVMRKKGFKTTSDVLSVLKGNNMKRNFMGLDESTASSVVEDHNDPEQIGRVKVRCLGIHTEDKETLPTDDLPQQW